MGVPMPRSRPEPRPEQPVQRLAWVPDGAALGYARDGIAERGRGRVVPVDRDRLRQDWGAEGARADIACATSGTVMRQETRVGQPSIRVRAGVPAMRSSLILAAALVAGCSESPGNAADAAGDAPPPADSAAPDAAVDARPCRADCDCTTAVCVAGRCDPTAGRAAMGICGVPGADCPCAGGTCMDRCCILPDGGVDNGSGPACMPVPGDAGP